MKSPTNKYRPGKASGFTFVEALVALIVLSIGLLGVAALQLTSLRSNHSSSLRSQATLLASDMVDRMRANRTAALAGAYDVDFDDVADDESTQQSQIDLVRWQVNLANTLPQGRGSIARTVVGTVATFTVIVQWDDTRGEGAPMEFAMETQI
jgi:type IV pilus assembly protein PilV